MNSWETYVVYVICHKSQCVCHSELNIAIFCRLEAYQEAYLREKAAKVAHYQRALAEQVSLVCHA